VPPFRKLLVPCDFSDDSKAALGLAIELGRQLGAEVHVFHAYRRPVEIFSPYGVPLPDGVVPEIREAARQALGDELARVHEAGLEGQAWLREGVAADSICDAAREIGADLVVMGTRGRTGLAHVVLGSVAERTIRCAPCAVVTVKAKD
jgi:nucleotide-binding universal stress UspA family protein